MGSCLQGRSGRSGGRATCLAWHALYQEGGLTLDSSLCFLPLHLLVNISLFSSCTLLWTVTV